MTSLTSTLLASIRDIASAGSPAAVYTTVKRNSVCPGCASGGLGWRIAVGGSGGMGIDTSSLLSNLAPAAIRPLTSLISPATIARSYPPFSAASQDPPGGVARAVRAVLRRVPGPARRDERVAGDQDVGVSGGVNEDRLAVRGERAGRHLDAHERESGAGEIQLAEQHADLQRQVHDAG